MYGHTPLEIKNLKAHFKLDTTVKLNTFFNVLSDEEKTKQLFKKINFSIFRDSQCKKIVYTIFHNSSHVNVTGIPTLKELNFALFRFNKQLQQNIKIDDVVIDNITAVGFIWENKKEKINLIPIEEHIRSLKLPLTTVNLRPDFFPGAVIRTKGYGTVILFSSGKYIIVGCKSECQLQMTQKNFLTNIQKIA